MTAGISPILLVLLMALVDSDYKFVWADIGGRGAASDAQLWNESDLKAAADNGDLDLPEPDSFPHDTEDIVFCTLVFGTFPFLSRWANVLSGTNAFHCRFIR